MRLLLWTLCVAAAGGALAQPPDSLDRDYGGELPRIAPLEIEPALAAFETAAGFSIELAAAEPLVVDPVAMAFDEDGRLFVVEMRGYSENAADNLGRVRVLTDRNGDGLFDDAQVLVDGLSWPTAILCYDGGVFVGAAPTIDYWKDADGDGRADLHEVVYEGFGKSNVQGLLNNLTWGLDNRVHVAVSSTGAELRRAGTDDPPLSLRGRDFSFDPSTLDFRAESGGGQHGMSMTRWGVKFVCSNSDHLQQILYEDRYAARNPFHSPPSARLSIASDGPQADVFRSSPIEPWRTVRTRLRQQQLAAGPLERGGLAAGYFTGATGVTMYTGDNWPAQFLDMAVVGDVGGNLVHRKRLEQQGLRFRGDRVDEQSEFVRSSDIWFRPVQMANGPDGCLYIADMYREVIEHPDSLPPIIKKHLDLVSGRDRGRIYRVRWSAALRRSPETMSGLSSEQLVQRLAHRNDWTRATAARLLLQRKALDQAAAVERLAGSDDALPEGRLRAAYLLASWGELSGDVVLKLIRDGNPWLREHATRLAEQTPRHAGVLAALLELATDPQQRVRVQLAHTLGEFDGPGRLEALSRLALNAPPNSPERAAVLTSLARGAGVALREAVNFEVSSPAEDDSRLAWIGLLAAQIGKQQRAEDVAILLQLLQAGASAQNAAWKAMLEALRLPENDPLAEQIALATQGRASESLRAAGTAAAEQALDGSQSIEQRVQAVGRLQLASSEQQRQSARRLLAAAQPIELQLAALDLLGRQREPEVAELIVAAWSGLSPAARQRAAEVLFTRAPWLTEFLDAVAQGLVSATEIDSSRAALLRAHSNPRIREQAQQLLGQVNSDRQQVVARYQAALSTPGDVERGRQVFKTNCAACHQLEGVGFPMGPNLAALRDRGADTILINVLDPNREVNPQYVNFLVRTSDGQALSGIIIQENAASIELRRAGNQGDTVLRVDIEELKSSGASIMPEGMEQQIDEQAMADLLEYVLQSS